MKTDTLFFQLFQEFPQLLFQLLDRSFVPGYTFTSVEVKEKSFRFDGILIPPEATEEPIYFIEVQFQYSPNFYWKFLSEIFLYLNQQKPDQDWIAVAIFPDRVTDEEVLSTVQQEMVDTGRIKTIYLDELPDSSVEFAMLKLITCPSSQAVEVVNQIRSVAIEQVILDFVRTILVYKFPKMSREEIEKMFTLDDLRQTRVYQESLQEGESRLLIRQLSRKFGTLSPDRIAQIRTLPVDRLEELGLALLDFTTIGDLENWLDMEVSR